MLAHVADKNTMAASAPIPNNPTTGKAWTRNELLTELEVERKRNSERTSGIVSWAEQVSNVQARWRIHLKEWTILTHQVYELGRECRVFTETRLLASTSTFSNAIELIPTSKNKRVSVDQDGLML